MIDYNYVVICLKAGSFYIRKDYIYHYLSNFSAFKLTGRNVDIYAFFIPLN